MVRAGGQPSLVTDGTLQGVLQLRPPGHVLGAGDRPRRPDRPGPRVHHRLPRRREAQPPAFPQPVHRRRGPRPGRRGQPRPARRGPSTPTTSGCATSGKRSSSPGGAVSEVLQADGWTAPAATAGWPMLWHDQTKVGRYDQGDPHPRIRCLRRHRRPRREDHRDPVHRPARPPPRTPAERAADGAVPWPGYRNPADEDRRSHLPVVPPPVQGLGRRASTSAAGMSPTRPGTRWPPACCAHGATPHPHPPLPRATSPTGWPSTTSSSAHSDLEDVLQRRVGRRARHRQPRRRCCPAPPPRSPASKPRRSRSTCPGAAPPPTAGSAPSSRSSTAAPARGTWTATTAPSFVLSGADLLYWRRKREQW